MKKISACLLAASLVSPFFMTSAMAGHNAQGVSSSQQNPGIVTLRHSLAVRMPSLKVDMISATPIPDLYQVIVGSQVVYMDKNAEYMIDGDMINLKTRANYSEKAKSQLRLAAIKHLGEKNMLIYRPKKVDHTITVVTDVNCPYCRRLHSEMPEYMKNNIEVRYIFMPLKGPADVRKTESIWCSADPRKALNIAKAGGTIKEKSCADALSLSKQMATARKLGVRGTPSIILEDGEMLPGYVPVDKLVAVLNRHGAHSN